jgi:hypothetical protein
LKKTVAERAKLQSADEIMHEIENTLKAICKNKEPFDAVHVAPSSSGDVPDQPSVRLVLLAPTWPHKHDKDDSAAMGAACEYLEHRGAAPRMYRNMILFLAPDESIITQLKQDVRMLKAWRSVEKDAESLNLDNAQKNEVKEAIKTNEKTVTDRLQESYQHLLIPAQHGTSPVVWEKLIVQGMNPVSKAAQKLRDDDFMTEAFSPKILSQEIAQYNLWKEADSLSIRELWENYARYLYLYRLTGYSVLAKALEAGIKSGEYFAYADGQDETGRYQSLCLGDIGYLHITQDGCLVKLEVAKSQIEKENAERTKREESDEGNAGDLVGEPSGDGQGTGEAASPPRPVKKNTHFYGSVKIDANKLGSTAGTINTEVLQHLNKLTGAQVSITLDIQVSIPEGVPDDVARTIRENCRTMRFDTSEFGE